MRYGQADVGEIKFAWVNIGDWPNSYWVTDESGASLMWFEVEGTGSRWEWVTWCDQHEIARSGDKGTRTPRWYSSSSSARRGAERWWRRLNDVQPSGPEVYLTV